MSGLPEHVRMQMKFWCKLLEEDLAPREQVINALRHRIAMNRFKPSALAELEQFMKELKVRCQTYQLQKAYIQMQQMHATKTSTNAYIYIYIYVRICRDKRQREEV
jgi:hypothetical protein